MNSPTASSALARTPTANRPNDALAREMEDFLSRRKERTARTYRSALYKFHEFLRRLRSRPALSRKDLSVTDLDDFRVWLANNQFSIFTCNNYGEAVKSFVTHLIARGRIAESYSLERAKAILKENRESFSYPVVKPNPRLPEIIRFYEEQPEPEKKTARLRLLRERAFAHTLYASAGRLAEVAALDRKDVQDGRRDRAVVQGKGNKERYIYLTADAQRAIAAYCAARQDGHEPLFISHAKDYGHRLDKSQLWRVIHVVAVQLGIDVTPHDFRHFRASQMLEQGAPLEAIQEILGHADIGTTRRVYAHYSDPKIRSMFEQYTIPASELRNKTDDSQPSTENNIVRVKYKH